MSNTIAPKELTVKSATAQSREYNGTNIVEVTTVELDGICGSDTVAVDTTDLTGTISGANASATAYDKVTLPELSLKNNELDNYTLTQPTDAVNTSVTVSKLSFENLLALNLLTIKYSVNGVEQTAAPSSLEYGDKIGIKLTFDTSKGYALPNTKGTLWIKGKTDTEYTNVGEYEFDTTGIVTAEKVVDYTPGEYVIKLTMNDATNYADISTAEEALTINKKSVTFDISDTEHIYQTGEKREITFTPSYLTKDDFEVKYYLVNENSGVLYSTTPETSAITAGKYLYVIDFAATQTGYTITDKFEVTSTTLPTGTHTNCGYMYIKSGVTGQQTPIYFKGGTVNLKVNDTYTNELTNENGTTPTFTSSNTDVATVDASGKVTAVGKGTATITAKSEKDETTPVYASYTVNVGLATVTLTKDSFDVTAQSKVYDGTDEVEISAVVKDSALYEGDNIKVDITGSFADANAGDNKTVNYTITGISGTGAENYVLENGKIESTTTANITKATVTIICATTTTRTYDGSTQSVDVSAMANGAVFESSNYTVKYAGSTAPSAVGSYAVTVELNDKAAKNYTVTQPNATLIIKSATQEVFSIEGVPEAVYYGDSFTLTADGASGTVTYSISSGAEFATINGADVTVTGVGKVTITATSVKDGHIDRIATKSFNAKQKVLTPLATATDRTYNGENGVTVEISLTGIVNNDIITATGTGTMLNADAGENKIVYVSGITLGGDKKDLYTLDTTSVQTTVDIAKKEITEITVSASDREYNGNTTATAMVETITGVIDADAGQVEVIGSAVFEDADSDEDKTVTFTATSLSGAKAANYYIDGTLTAEATATIEPVKVNFVVGQTYFFCV